MGRSERTSHPSSVSQRGRSRPMSGSPPPARQLASPLRRTPRARESEGHPPGGVVEVLVEHERRPASRPRTPWPRCGAAAARTRIPNGTRRRPRPQPAGPRRRGRARGRRSGRDPADRARPRTPPGSVANGRARRPVRTGEDIREIERGVAGATAEVDKVCPILKRARRHASSARGRQTRCWSPRRATSASWVPRRSPARRRPRPLARGQWAGRAALLHGAPRDLAAFLLQSRGERRRTPSVCCAQTRFRIATSPRRRRHPVELDKILAWIRLAIARA